MGEPVIVAAVRTPVGRGIKGALKDVRPENLAALAIDAVLDRASALKPALVDDVVLGCATPEGPQGLNIGRMAMLMTRLPDTTPGMTVNRYCSSGLEVIAQASDRILAGRSRATIAGGVESMSAVPLAGYNVTANPDLFRTRPEAYISMGLTAENVAAQFKVSREDQDLFAQQSHDRALAAQKNGWFDGQLVPVPYKIVSTDAKGRPQVQELKLEKDEGPRADSSLEKLAKLKPAFKSDGTVTAGNSSQISDGAAAVLIVDRALAEELGLKPLARLIAYQVRGVAPEIMGIGPIAAVPRALAEAKLDMKDIGVIELNEAFAAQSLAVVRELKMDPAKVNVNGGAIALGHPLGATGTKLTVQIVAEMHRRNLRYGLVTMCIGGGMGAAGIFEKL
ncbi:MAG: thiolase family protein [Planctomycetota bacterium]